MDQSQLVFSLRGILQARILEWVSHSCLQGIFPTQGSNPGLPPCGQILYHLSHQESPPKYIKDANRNISQSRHDPVSFPEDHFSLLIEFHEYLCCTINEVAGPFSFLLPFKSYKGRNVSLKKNWKGSQFFNIVMKLNSLIFKRL